VTKAFFRGTDLAEITIPAEKGEEKAVERKNKTRGRKGGRPAGTGGEKEKSAIQGPVLTLGLFRSGSANRCGGGGGGRDGSVGRSMRGIEDQYVCGAPAKRF